MKIKELYGTFTFSNKGIIASAFVLTLISNALAILIPLLIGKYYQLTFGLTSSRAQLLHFIPEQFTNTAQAFFIFFGACIAIRLFTFFGSDFLIGVIGEKLVVSLRKKLFRAHMQIPLKEYNQSGFGKYLLRFTGDLNSIKNHFTRGILKSSSDVLLFIFAFIVIGNMSMELMSIMMMILSFGFAILFALHTIVYRRLELFRNRKSNLISFVSRSFSVIHSIFVFNKQSTETQKFDRYVHKIYKSAKKFLSIQYLYRTLIVGISYAFLIVTLIYGYYNQNAALSSSDLLVTIMLIMTLLAPMRRLFKIGLILEKGNLSWVKYLRVLDRVHTSNGNRFKYTDQSITLDNTIVLQPGINYIRKDIFANTYIDLLLRADEDTDNIEIKIGDINLEDIDKKQWRRNISVVDTRYPLIGRTVFECISYSRAISKRERAQKIIDIINKHLNTNEQFHLDMKVGNNGSWLSERQNLLLLYARAILSRKPIVLINHDYFPDLKECTNELVAKITESSRIKTTVIFKNLSLHSHNKDKRKKKAS